MMKIKKLRIQGMKTTTHVRMHTGFANILKSTYPGASMPFITKRLFDKIKFKKDLRDLFE